VIPPKRHDRLKLATNTELAPDSLVGTFFHSDAKRGWQGCIVAEPSPGIYLAELFSWLAGDSWEQVLIHLHEMIGWHFYDTAEWMNNNYEHGGLQGRWEREREPEEMTE
jgi:hypothetical protein